MIKTGKYIAYNMLFLTALARHNASGTRYAAYTLTRIVRKPAV
jgi:hypothetical protein